MSDVCLCFSLFSSSRCQMYIYVLGCSVVLNVRCSFMFYVLRWFYTSGEHLCFRLFSSSRRQMYFYVLNCAEVRRQMYIDVLGCSVVLDVKCIFMF